MLKLFNSKDEFIKEMNEILDVLKNKGIKEAEPLAENFKKKYSEEAKITKGAECSGCTSCAGCAICGPSAIEAIQLGHGLQLVHLNN